MLFREDGEALIAISQPSHAWLSGQMMRRWGNRRFAPPLPFEEVALGTELHDIGWLAWEASPTLNPATGRPYEFREVPVEIHTELWKSGVGHALAFGRYPALLVSLHANTIYGTFFDMTKASEADAARVFRFLDGQHGFQSAMIAALSRDPRYREAVAPEMVERNRLLVAAADRLSLEICWGVTDDRELPNVPVADGERLSLRLRAPSGDPDRLSLAPWPFAEDRMSLRCEGRRLAGRYQEEEPMRLALADPAAAMTLLIELRPG